MNDVSLFDTLNEVVAIDEEVMPDALEPAVTGVAEPYPAAPEGRPKARLSDPATSKAAAVSMTPVVLGEQCARVLLTIVELERTNPHRLGASAYEVMCRMAFDGAAVAQSVIARRITDLADRGLVFDSGETRTGSSARHLVCWATTVAGKRQAEALR